MTRLIHSILFFVAFAFVVVSSQTSNVTGKEPESVWPERLNNEVNFVEDQFSTYGEIRYSIPDGKWHLYTSNGGIVKHVQNDYSDDSIKSDMKFVQMSFGGNDYWVLFYWGTIDIWSMNDSTLVTFTDESIPEAVTFEEYHNSFEYLDDFYEFGFGKYLFAGPDIVYDIEQALIEKKLVALKYDEVEGLSVSRKKWIRESCFQDNFYCAPYLNGTAYPAESEGIDRGNGNETVVLFFGSAKMFVKCGNVGVDEDEYANLLCHYYIDDGKNTTYFIPKNLIPENFDRTKELRTMLWPLIRLDDPFMKPYLASVPDTDSSSSLFIIVGCVIVSVVVLILVVVGGIALYHHLRYRHQLKVNREGPVLVVLQAAV